MDDVKQFNESEFLESVRAAAAEDIKLVVEKVVYQVGVGYTMDGAVTEAQAKACVAINLGVSEAQVSVVIGTRRLQQQRRLAATSIDATITGEKSAVADLATKAANVFAFTEVLQSQGVTAVASIAEAPKKSVAVTTRMESAGTAVAAPASEILSTQLEATMGVKVQASVTNIATKVTPAVTVVTLAAAPVQQAPSPSPDQPSLSPRIAPQAAPGMQKSDDTQSTDQVPVVLIILLVVACLGILCAIAALACVFYYTPKTSQVHPDNIKPGAGEAIAESGLGMVSKGTAPWEAVKTHGCKKVVEQIVLPFPASQQSQETATSPILEQGSFPQPPTKEPKMMPARSQSYRPAVHSVTASPVTIASPVAPALGQAAPQKQVARAKVVARVK